MKNLNENVSVKNKKVENLRKEIDKHDKTVSGIMGFSKLMMK